MEPTYQERLVHRGKKIFKHLDPGKYLVKIRHEVSNETGKYSIKVRKPKKLDVNTNNLSSGNLDQPSQEDIYQLTITSTGQYKIETDAKKTLKLEFLYGEKLISSSSYDYQTNPGVNENKTLDIQTSGEYFVKVRHQPETDTGNYSIGVKRGGIGGSTESGKCYEINLKSQPNEDNKDILLILSSNDPQTASILFWYKVWQPRQQWIITDNENIKTNIQGKGDWALDLVGDDLQMSRLDPKSETQKWHLTDNGVLQNKSKEDSMLVVIQYAIPSQKLYLWIPKVIDSQTFLNQYPHVFPLRLPVGQISTYKKSSEWEFTEV